MCIRCGRVVQTPYTHRLPKDKDSVSQHSRSRHCLCGSPLPVWVGHSCPTPLIFLLPCGLHIRCGPPLPVWVGHSCPTPLILSYSGTVPSLVEPERFTQAQMFTRHRSL